LRKIDFGIQYSIKAFVNRYSMQLGDEGRRAVEILTGKIP